jgi:hypothetical protein
MNSGIDIANMPKSYFTAAPGASLENGFSEPADCLANAQLGYGQRITKDIVIVARNLTYSRHGTHTFSVHIRPNRNVYSINLGVDNFMAVQASGAHVGEILVDLLKHYTFERDHWHLRGYAFLAQLAYHFGALSEEDVSYLTRMASTWQRTIECAYEAKHNADDRLSSWTRRQLSA